MSSLSINFCSQPADRYFVQRRCKSVSFLFEDLGPITKSSVSIALSINFNNQPAGRDRLGLRFFFLIFSSARDEDNE